MTLKPIFLPEDRHFWLYAKGWYQETDTLSDLRKIQSKYSGIYVENISDIQVFDHLAKIAGRILLRKDEYAFAEFLSSILPHNYWKVSRGNAWNVQLAIIEDCLFIIRIEACHNREDNLDFDLGLPDPAILPLKNSKIISKESQMGVDN